MTRRRRRVIVARTLRAVCRAYGGRMDLPSSMRTIRRVSGTDIMDLISTMETHGAVIPYQTKVLCQCCGPTIVAPQDVTDVMSDARLC